MLDALICPSIIQKKEFRGDEEKKQGSKKNEFSQELLRFNQQLQTCLERGQNSKVLIPVSHLFILEIIDLLCFQIDEKVQINLIYESANAII